MEKYNPSAQGSFQEETSYRDKQLGYERTCSVQYRGRALRYHKGGRNTLRQGEWNRAGTMSEKRYHLRWALSSRGNTTNCWGCRRKQIFSERGWHELKPRGRKTQGIFRIY